MNAQGLPWVVMNNYEALPHVIPSDIDVSVPPALFARLDGFVQSFAAGQGAQVVQKLWHGNQKCAYVLATGPAGRREFVQLDCFTAFSTKSAPALLPHDELIAGRRRLHNFHVPRPEVELVFTAMRRLFKNDWSERHCARIRELHARIDSPDWLPRRLDWLRPTLEAAIEGDSATASARRDRDWVALRKHAAGNLSARERLSNASVQARRIATRLRYETGQLVILAAPESALGEAALASLDLVFHRRLILTARGTPGLAAKLSLLKRRKGLILVIADNAHPEGQVLARWLSRLGLADLLLVPADDPEPTFVAQHIPLAPTRFGSDADAIEAIIAVQSAKTARAMARGGTQTSGGLR